MIVFFGGFVFFFYGILIVNKEYEVFKIVI